MYDKKIDHFHFGENVYKSYFVCLFVRPFIWAAWLSPGYTRPLAAANAAASLAHAGRMGGMGEGGGRGGWGRYG